MTDQRNDELRICFSVDRELKDRLRNKVEWGDIRSIYTAITEQLVYLLEEYDPDVVQAGIVSREIQLTDLIDYMKRQSEKNKTDETKPT